MLTKRKIATLDRALAARQAEVAKARDKLDDTISEWAELKEHCEEAYDELQRARDALSRLV